MKLVVRPYAGESDLPLVARLLGGVSSLAPDLLDYPWRLGAPAAATGRGDRRRIPVRITAIFMPFLG